MVYVPKLIPDPGDETTEGWMRWWIPNALVPSRSFVSSRYFIPTELKFRLIRIQTRNTPIVRHRDFNNTVHIQKHKIRVEQKTLHRRKG